jgi:hypothetical protein
MSKRNKSCQNKDWLFDQYVTQGKSSGKIAEEIVFSMTITPYG